jgi:Mg2+/Co2+ transporter CorB
MGDVNADDNIDDDDDTKRKMEKQQQQQQQDKTKEVQDFLRMIDVNVDWHVSNVLEGFIIDTSDSFDSSEL